MKNLFPLLRPAALLLLLAAAALPARAQTTLTVAGTTLTVQPGAVLYVAGAVQNTATGTLANAGTVQLTGDLANAGTLASAGLLLFSGTTNQVFTPGAATVAALTLDNAGAAGQRTLVLANDLTVTGALTLLNGLVRTAPVGAATPLFALTLPDGASLTGEAPGRYVEGSVRVLRNSGSGVLDFGHGAVLDRTGLGNVAITRTAGLLAPGVSYGTNLAGTTRVIDRVWTVLADVAPAPAAPAALTLSWLPDNDNSLNPASPMQLWHAASAAGPWSQVGTPGSAAGRSFATSISALGTFTVSNVSAPLPVELVRFTAEPQGTDALLTWATASEKNNDRFEVESSADGQTFARIGTVPGHGSSAQAHEYQLTDKTIARYAADPVYYRLRQVDTDGTATYSPVRTVRVSGGAGFAVQLYPNPVRNADAPTLLVRTAEAGPLRWQLTDALGRTVSSQSAALPVGTSPVPLGRLGSLPTGVYLLRVQQGNHYQAIKLVRE